MPRTHQNGLVKQVMRICLAQVAAILISVLAVLTVLAAVIVYLCGSLSAVLYRVSHELTSLLRESVPYVKIYRYNPKHLCPKLNGYGDNGKRSLKL